MLLIDSKILTLKRIFKVFRNPCKAAISTSPSHTQLYLIALDKLNILDYKWKMSEFCVDKSSFFLREQMLSTLGQKIWEVSTGILLADSHMKEARSAWPVCQMEAHHSVC